MMFVQKEIQKLITIYKTKPHAYKDFFWHFAWKKLKIENSHISKHALKDLFTLAFRAYLLA